MNYENLMPNNICTYNSHAIESMLYKIPNLSDYFFYFNDDMILLKPVKIENIIDNITGKILYPTETDIILSSFQRYDFLKKIENTFIKVDPGVSNSRRHSIKRMNIPFTKIVSGHTPKLLNKRLCSIFNKKFEKEINELMGNKFRTNIDFTYLEAFIHYYIYKKIARWNDQSTRIIGISDNNLLNNIQILLTYPNKSIYDYLAIEDIRTKIVSENEKTIIDFLDKLFLEKSSFELGNKIRI
jgi:hypothetical protein